MNFWRNSEKYFQSYGPCLRKIIAPDMHILILPYRILSTDCKSHFYLDFVFFIHSYDKCSKIFNTSSLLKRPR